MTKKVKAPIDTVESARPWHEDDRAMIFNAIDTIERRLRSLELKVVMLTTAYGTATLILGWYLS